MMATNEIEVRMRWTHGSWQTMNVGRAIPPNLSDGHEREVGPWGIPTGLSAEFSAGVLSANRTVTPFGVYDCR
jgi:hypothetical protein